MRLSYTFALIALLLSCEVFAAPGTAIEWKEPPVLKEKVKRENSTFAKKITRGHAEISPEAALGYNEGQGLYFDMNLSYRYFFKDRLSLGLVGGVNRRDGLRDHRIGLSGRWYFLEADKWAFAFTQNISYGFAKFDRFSYNPATDTFFSFQESRNYWQASSGLGAYYFITPGVSLGLSLEIPYGTRSGSLRIGDVTSRVGLNFSF